MRAHGDRARYVAGPDENDVAGRGCRCRLCRAAVSAYEQERRQRIEPAYVSAGPAREHLAMLSERGVGLKTVAAVSGVSHGALTKIVYGASTRGRGPSKRIRPDTARRILAVTAAAAAAGARVDAGPTWALIDEMLAAGIPKSRIAAALGRTGPGLQLARGTVLRRNADAVAAFHAAWKAGEIEVDGRRNRQGVGRTTVPPAEQRAPESVSPFGAIGDLVTALAEAVELRNEQPWRRDAACRNRPGWMWFPARGDTKTAAAAIRVCRACVVRERCLAENVDEREGIYGGLSAKARRKLKAVAA